MATYIAAEMDDPLTEEVAVPRSSSKFWRRFGFAAALGIAVATIGLILPRALTPMLQMQYMDGSTMLVEQQAPSYALQAEGAYCENRGGLGGSNQFSKNVGIDNVDACAAHVQNTVGCGEWFSYGIGTHGWCDCVPVSSGICTQASYPNYNVYKFEARHPSLELRSTSSYEESYSDRGTGSRVDLSVWRPKLFSGEYRLFYTGSRSRSNSHETLVVKKAHHGALYRPQHFVCKWTDRGTGGDIDGSLWQAIAPSGYTCLSDVAVHLSNSGNSPGKIRSAVEIDPHFRCVHNSLVRDTELGPFVWSDVGSGGTYDGAVWSISHSDGMRVGRGGSDVPPHQQSRLKAFVGELWRDLNLVKSVCNHGNHDNGPFSYELFEGRTETSSHSETKDWQNEVSMTASVGVDNIVQSSISSTIAHRWGGSTTFSSSETTTRDEKFSVSMTIPKKTCTKLFQLIVTDSATRGRGSFKIRSKRYVICQDPIDAASDCVGSQTQ